MRLMPQAAARLGLSASPTEEDRAAVVRGLVRAVQVPVERLPSLVFEFSPQAVRQRFEAMVEVQGLKRREKPNPKFRQQSKSHFVRNKSFKIAKYSAENPKKSNTHNTYLQIRYGRL